MKRTGPGATGAGIPDPPDARKRRGYPTGLQHCRAVTTTPLRPSETVRHRPGAGAREQGLKPRKHSGMLGQSLGPQGGGIRSGAAPELLAPRPWSVGCRSTRVGLSEACSLQALAIAKIAPPLAKRISSNSDMRRQFPSTDTRSRTRLPRDHGVVCRVFSKQKNPRRCASRRGQNPGVVYPFGKSTLYVRGSLSCNLVESFGVPKGIRTPVTGVRERP